MSSVQEGASGQYPVQLFVYDLSNGMARALSMQLTGRNFDAIYHTSVVVHGREWYFGQGIHSARPGQTHFGSPIERLDLGTTAIDSETFQEFIHDLAERFTAQAYHLLNFNCNTFTNEVANVLVGRDIPAHITSLPQDFLATPFGAMMRPHIESMFRTSGPQEQQIDAAPSSAAASHPAAASLVRGIAQQAYSSQPSPSNAAPHKASLCEVASQTDLDSFLASQQCAVVLFTSQSCPPCVQLRPLYESLAEQYAQGDAHRQRPIVFGRIESSARTAEVMRRQNIHATPTVRFYLDGKMINEVKGANPGALRDGIEALLWERFRPHPHAKMDSPLPLVPAQPIVFRTIPNLMSAQQKLDEVVSKHKASNFAQKADLQDARGVLTKTLIPWIKSGPAMNKNGIMSVDDVRQWTTSARKSVEILETSSVFPIIDLVRIALLDPDQASRMATGDASALFSAIVAKAKEGVENVDTCKATLLTSFRMASNVLALHKASLVQKLNSNDDLIALLVLGVLCEDASVRSAAINASFNLAKELATSRSTYECVAPLDTAPRVEMLLGVDEQVEILCAILECIEKEEDLERLHRAAATLALLLYCAPQWSVTTRPMLEVVEAPAKLQEKAKWVTAASSQTSGADDQKTKVHDIHALLVISAQLAGAGGP